MEKYVRIRTKRKIKIRILDSDINLKERKKRRNISIYKRRYDMLKSMEMKGCKGGPNSFKVCDGHGDVIAEINFDNIRFELKKI